MSELDPASVVREVVRALRGTRSQVQLSRRLGYRSNVVYRWEAGLRIPTAVEVLRVAERVGLDPAGVFRSYDERLAADAERAGPPGDREHLRAWLEAMRGGRTLAEVAARSGLSRPVVQRLFAGATEVPADHWLRLVDTLDERVVDLVGALVPLEAVPALGPRRRAIAAQREQTFRLRWTEAVLAALEVHGDAPEDPVTAIAGRLSRPEPEVREIVEALVRTGGLLWVDGRPRVPPNRRVHTGVDRERHLDLARFWARTAAELEGPPIARGYLVVSMAEADLPALFELHRRLHVDTVELVARSPAERVVVVSVQTAALDGLPLPRRGR